MQNSPKSITLPKIAVRPNIEKIWAEKQDQNEFHYDSVQADKSIDECDCLLNCLMKEYTDYDIAIKDIQSQAVPEQLSICVEQCK